MDFYDLDLSDPVLDALDDMNFINCTPIQEHAIPAILDGHDMIGVAQTGTGKTAAYLLPVLSKLSDEEQPDHRIKCIVMSPTRELAQQIDQALEGFSYYVPVSSVAVYGGNDGIRYEQEKKGLKMGADIIIATPGRLISHLSLSNIDLSGVRYFILDEADRMLDMGFYEDIMQIVNQLPKERQTILFSATMPPKIQQLSKAILNNPVEIKIAVSKPAEKIAQEVVYCVDREKIKAIKWLFKSYPTKRVIIFASSKMKVKEITRELLSLKFNVGQMHSDLEQKERDEVMYQFKIQKIDILVATDIVARGIDIDDIQLVINFDLPHDAEDYVHRIGRTARANNTGMAITLINEKEYGKFKRMYEFLEIEIPAITLPDSFTPPVLVDEYAEKKKKKKRSGSSNKKMSGGEKQQKKQQTAQSKPETSAPNTTASQTEGASVVSSDEAKPEKKKNKRRRPFFKKRKPAAGKEGGSQNNENAQQHQSPVSSKENAGEQS